MLETARAAGWGLTVAISVVASRICAAYRLSCCIIWYRIVRMRTVLHSTLWYNSVPKWAVEAWMKIGVLRNGGWRPAEVPIDPTELMGFGDLDLAPISFAAISPWRTANRMAIAYRRIWRQTEDGWISTVRVLWKNLRLYKYSRRSVPGRWSNWAFSREVDGSQRRTKR